MGWRTAAGANAAIPDFSISIPAQVSGLTRKVVVIQLAETNVANMRIPTLNGTAETGASSTSSSQFSYRVSWWDEAQLPSAAGSYTVSNCGGSTGTFTGDMGALAICFIHALAGSLTVVQTSWLAGNATGSLNISSSAGPANIILFAMEPDPTSTLSRYSGSNALAQLIDVAGGTNSNFIASQMPVSDNIARVTGFTRSVTTNPAYLFRVVPTGTDLAAGFRVARPISGKGATSNNAKATTFIRARPVTANAATATSALGDLTVTSGATSGNLVTTGSLVMHL